MHQTIRNREFQILDPLEPRTLLAAVQVGERFVDVSGLGTGYAILEGDFNNDGRVDVVTRIADRAGSRFELELNRGRVSPSGFGQIRFVPAQPLPIAAQTSEQLYRSQIVAGHFDADGDLDLLVINPLPAAANNGAGGIRVRLLKGDGRGHFTACRQDTSTFSLAGNTVAYSASFDGPGARDSVVLLGPRGLFTFKLGNSGRIAVPREPFAGQLPAHPRFDNPKFGDIDGDGRTDLVVRDNSGDGSILFIRSLGQSSLELTTAPRDVALSISVSKFILADTDGDPARLDVVFTAGADVVTLELDAAPGQPLSFPAPRVLVSLPDPPLAYPVISRTFRVREVTDVNGDGRLDFLTETTQTTSERDNPTYSTVVLMIADGLGGFESSAVASGFGNQGLVYSNWVLRDFDGDGIKDVYDTSYRQVRRVVRPESIRLPVIGSLRITDFDLLSGRRSIIASGVASPIGQVEKVQFFWDGNHDGVFNDGDPFVDRDNKENRPGVWSGRLRFDHEYGGPGVARFFAVAIDENGFRSEPVAVDVILL